MGICDSTKNKKKNTKETKVILPESEVNENQKSGPVKLSSDFVEDDEINKRDYELQTQIAIEATNEEIAEASRNKASKNNNNSDRLRANKKVYYKQVKIEKKSDGTVIRTTIENGKKIIETFKPKNKTNRNNNNSNRNYNNNNNNNINSNTGRKIINNNNNNNNNIKGNNFQEEALRAHNDYRRKHHSPNLTLNNDLNRIAQNYANKIAKEYSLQHSNNEYKGEPLGENIYMVSGMKPTGRDMTKSWYDEINKYNFNGDWQSGCGHFTQMIWKDTKEVGFGKWKDKSGQIYVVANYFPAGNFLGCFKENVLRK